MSASSTERHPSVDYDLLEQQVTSLFEQERDFIANSATFAALLYHALPEVNWAGFYFPEAGDLLLGPFGGKPACVRLPKGGGVCGRAFELAQSIIVDDVNAFDGHIACDSASRSEMVVPLLRGGAVFGVFDIDSPQVARFTKSDKAGVERLVAKFMNLTAVPDRYKTPVKTSTAAAINRRIDVQTCRDHHTVLRFLIEDLDRPETRAEDVLGQLGRIRNVLLAHLKLEDDCLYPKLEQSENAIVRAKAARYRNEMGDLRGRFITLWERWSAPQAISSEPDHWWQDWRAIKQSLLDRIETEDHDLYLAAEADPE